MYKLILVFILFPYLVWTQPDSISEELMKVNFKENTSEMDSEAGHAYVGSGI